MKNIDNEILRLLDIKEQVDDFNKMRSTSREYIVPISLAKYRELASLNKLNEDALYYVLNQEVGQYIDGYLDIS